MNYGKDIRMARQSLKISQEALARILRVSWITVNRWERGQPEPSFLVLRGIESVLREHFKDRNYSWEVFTDEGLVKDPR